MRILNPIIAMIVLLAMPHAASMAQPIPDTALPNIWILNGGAGTGNWTTGSNWDQGSVPDVDADDFAVINGGGTAQINSVVGPSAGGVVLGETAADSGTLEILGGSLDVTDDPVFDADGIVRVGNIGGGAGTLIMSGGTLTSLQVYSNGAAGSLISLSGSSTINTGTANLARSTRVAGPNVNFSASGNMTLAGAHTLIAEITGPNHSPLTTSATANVAGALEVEFNGYEPVLSDTWDLVTGTTLLGGFDSLSVSGSPPLELGQAFAVRTAVDGPNTVLRLGIDQLLVLTVDRDNDIVTIDNPGSGGIEFDGYLVDSPSGALNQAAWTSLQSQSEPGWEEANPSAQHLAELNPGSSSTLGSGSSFSLGDIYDPPEPIEFGQSQEDLAFEYTVDGTESIQGVVRYLGTSNINNLVLFADPETGDVALRNTSPFTVEFDAYTVFSPSDELNFTDGNWNSLDDQDVDNGSWQEANVGADRVTEYNPDGSTTLAHNTTFDLGQLFTVNGDENLVFEFLLGNEVVGRTGEVIYDAAPEIGEVLGDYNGNGVVDTADYSVWLASLGGTTLLNEAVTPGAVDQADYAYWKMHFGETAGSGSSVAAAVPEPAAGSILCCAIAACACARRRQDRHWQLLARGDVYA